MASATKDFKDNEIAALHRLVEILERTNNSLASENERLREALKDIREIVLNDSPGWLFARVWDEIKDIIGI